jgi:cytosine/adenosine deaminase-related metal-dependent hydrolase
VRADRSDVFYAHGIHFNDDELKVLQETGSHIAHCPSSNMRLGSGICRVKEMLAMGINVGIAVDGSASNDSPTCSARCATHCCFSAYAMEPTH